MSTIPTATSTEGVLAATSYGAAEPASPDRGSNKIRVLDGMRAVAIILVLIAHVGLDKVVPGGLGVTIFFFLSGYLITTLMRKEIDRTGSLDIGKFYLRRALRILPPLYITLVIVVGLVLLGIYPSPLNWTRVLFQFVHLANYMPDGTGELPAMPLWSLAVEEHFYLVFPFLYLYLLRRMSGKNQALVLLSLCAVTLCVRVAIASTFPDYHLIYNWSHTRIDSILFGCILAVWSNPVLDEPRQSYHSTQPHFWIAIFVLFVCLAFRSEFFRQTFRYSLQGLALFAVFSYLISQKSGLMYQALTSKPMKMISLLSYTMYLINYFISTLLEIRYPHVPMVVRGVITIGLTFGYAALMYWWVEQPLSKVRSKMH